MTGTIYGMDIPEISEHLKGAVVQAGVCVIGLLGDGTSRDMTQSWGSPFENDTLENAMGRGAGGKIGNLAKRGIKMTGATTMTTLNTQKVWQSGDHTLTLVLKFFVTQDGDPVSQVSRAVQSLEEMASPDIGTFPTGRQPGLVAVNIGRRVIFPEMLIQGVPVALDKEVDSAGNMLRCTLSLSMTPFHMLGKPEIHKTYGAPSRIVPAK